jgi:hypothetical protein
MLDKRNSGGEEMGERKFKSPLLASMMSKRSAKKDGEDKSAGSSPTHEADTCMSKSGSTDDLEEKESLKSPDEDKDVDTTFDSATATTKKNVTNQNLVSDSDSSSSLSNQMSETANDSVHVTVTPPAPNVTLVNGRGVDTKSVTVNGIKDDYEVDNPAVIDTRLV